MAVNQKRKTPPKRGFIFIQPVNYLTSDITIALKIRNEKKIPRLFLMFFMINIKSNND